MKAGKYFSIVVLLFTLIAAGCAADAPEPVPGATPTLEQADAETQPEEANEIDPIRVGVNANSLAPLVIIEGEAYSGFEIDLATEIVAQLYGGETPIEWVPITSADRFTSLAEGQIDMLVRSLLHTVSREEMALFSGGYLLSGNAFLVFQGGDISSVADLDGRNIATLSFMENGLKDTANAQGYSFSSVIVEDMDGAIYALDYDEAEAIFHDWVLLAGSMSSAAHSIILEESQLAPIGIGFALDDEDTRDEVDIVLSEMISDGTWQSIFDNWFGIAVPWNLDDMFDYPADNR